MQTVHWKISGKNRQGIRAAIVSDLHNRNHGVVLNAVTSEHPDIILIPGDFMSALNNRDRHYAPTPKHSNLAGFELLRRFSELAPTFYSLGNHESQVDDKNRARIRATGAILLEDDFIRYRNLLIGGLNSVITPGDHINTPAPNLRFLKRFSSMDGTKLLLSHHPEVYDRYIRPLPIDIVVSGHAHGGQWRIGNQGVFAPGQGLFPKYTLGIYDKRLVVSPGLSNHTWVPRIFDPPTLVILSF